MAIWFYYIVFNYTLYLSKLLQSFFRYNCSVDGIYFVNLNAHLNSENPMQMGIEATSDRTMIQVSDEDDSNPGKLSTKSVMFCFYLGEGKGGDTELTNSKTCKLIRNSDVYIF